MTALADWMVELLRDMATQPDHIVQLTKAEARPMRNAGLLEKCDSHGDTRYRITSDGIKFAKENPR